MMFYAIIPPNTTPGTQNHAQPPTIHPADIVAEGGSMTVLCLALGNPAPTISLYVGGHLVRQDTSRHMVTTIHNVTTDMQHVSCYADNGYGIPMQASKKIYISCKSAHNCRVSAINCMLTPLVQFVFDFSPHSRTPNPGVRHHAGADRRAGRSQVHGARSARAEGDLLA